MGKKKETGGLISDDLLQPGDDQVLDNNKLIDTTKTEEEKNKKQDPVSVLGQSFFGPNAGQISRQLANPYTGGIQVENVDYEKYDKYIDRPFSLNESDIDDTRAEGQSFGEKAIRSYGAKLPVGIFTNVVGNTIGLGIGLGEVIDKGFQDGFGKSSTWGAFWNNDFQRSLDGINESVREALPNYYSQKEYDYTVWQSAFGPGAANFWTDSAVQGLSFVAGAVISEFLTAGLASAMIPVKAANHMKRIASLRNTTYGQKAIAGNANLQRINRAEKVWSGLTAARRFATGAMYEAGVESRHNFDATVNNLVNIHTEKTGRPPSEQEMLEIQQLAYTTANGVFAANAALVGYSNMLMFPKIFGKGMRQTNKNLKGKFKEVTKDGVTKLVPKYKDYSTFRKMSGGAYNLLKRPLYEGFVEEGGQKTADIAGQQAAEQYYLNGEDPNTFQAIGGMLNQTWDAMGEAYGSNEGQKEIFLGFVLGGLGLPTFVKTNPETGKKEFGLGWQGGIKESVLERISSRKELDNLAEYINKNPDALQAIKQNFDLAKDLYNGEKQKEWAILTENDNAYKNADHDSFFSYVYHRLKAGYFGDVVESIEDIRNMSNDAFEEMFDYGDMTSNMSTKERAEFLEDRKNKVIEQHTERAHAIKELVDNTSGLNVGEKYKKALVHAYSSAKDLDAREELLIEELTGDGLDLSAETIEDVQSNDKKENNSLLQRVKNFTMDKLGLKAKEVMENSEVGRQVKKELGIKQFTEPGHPHLVLQRLAEKADRLEKKAAALEAQGKDTEALEVLYELDDIKEQMAELAIGIKQGVAPDLSSEEQQILDKFEKENPAKFLEKKDEYIKKLQDLRNIRAQRHRMLNLVQQLIDPDASEDKIQQIENYIEDITENEEFKGLSDYEKNIARKYRGKIIKFDYTNKKGETKTYRGLYKEQGDKGIIVIPDAEAFKLMKRLELLESKVNKTADDIAEIELLKEQLEKTNPKYQTFNPANENLKNISIVDSKQIQLEGLQAVLDVLEDDLATNLEEVNKSVYETQFKILEVGEQVKEVLRAIQNAKKDKGGRLVVNLNSIGRKGRFGIQGAQKVLAEVIETENALKEKERQLVDAVNTLEEHALKMHVIYNLMNKPESVSDIIGRPATQEDALELINEFLDIASEDEFFKDLVDKGYFDKNTLSVLSLSEKEGGKEVDKEILRELLQKLNQDGNDITEYLDLINSDLANFKSELKKLTDHRKEVELMLNKFLDENNQVKLFPPDGLTADDQKWLTRELAEIDKDLRTLESIIENMEASTEQSLRDDLNEVQTALQTRSVALNLQNGILNTLGDYARWLEGMMAPAETTTKEDNGKGESGTQTNIDYSDEQLWSDNKVGTNFRPGLLQIPFTKTTGSHQAARDKYDEFQELLKTRDLTAAEQMHYEHVMSQLRFFKASEDLTDWTKSTGARLMIVHRNNIPAELQDKIIFYDSNIKTKDPSKRFVYANDLSPTTDITNENIKLLLVDNNLEPILVDDKIVYTDMPVSTLFGENGNYRYAESDLNSDGQPKAAVLKVAEQYKEHRQQLLQSQVPLYYRVTGKGKSMTIWENGNPQSKGSVLGRLVQKEEELKSVQLEVAVGDKGADRALISIGGNQWSVPNGFIYMSRPQDKSGIKGNLVRGIPNMLGENSQRNVYNILRLFASRQRLVGEGKMDANEAWNIGGKGMTTILSELVFFDKKAKNRKLTEYSIWIEKDAIHYGNQGQNITLEQLADPKKFEAEHGALLEFLGTLTYNANRTRLLRDKQARIDATTAKREAIRKAKGEKAKLYAKRRKITPEYEEFIEVKVDDNLEVTTENWSNYTEFLLSSKGRDITEIPVVVNMPLDLSGREGQESSTVPQFLNMYMTHDGVPKTAQEMKDGVENQEKAEEKSQEPVTVKLTDSGKIEVESSETSLMPVDEAENLVKEKLRPTPVRVLNKKGEVVFEGIINVASGKDLPASIAEALKGSLVPGHNIKSPVEVNIDPGKRKIEESPFTSTRDPNAEEDAEEDTPYLLKSSVEYGTPNIINLDEQLKWFNRVMPKDANGRPIIPIELIKGLIDGKGYGKFTKDGRILLSSEMDVDGVVYHETWHGVTRVLLPSKDRYKMYDEVRKMRGKARTFKNEVKNLSEFTDKEADEWLAEEFRAYVIADGNYTVGQNVKKSWLDRLFDKIFEILNFFSNRTSMADNLMSKIHGGYFANPTTAVTVYQNTEEAYMEAEVISPTLINNTVEGMTVSVFNIAAENGIFEIEDIFDLSKQGEVSAAINNLYGGPGQSNTVYNKMLGSLQSRERTLNGQLDVAKTKTQKEFLQQEIVKIQTTRDIIKKNWDFFIDQHKAFLQRYKLQVIDDLEINEDDKSGIGFDTPQVEMDPNLLLPHPVRLLIATLPATQELNGKRSFVYNNSGFPKLVDFGGTMAFLYKELSNMDPNNILPELQKLQEIRPEIKSLIKRLGAESNDWADKTGPQVRMLTRFIQQFNQANRKFYMQRIDRQGGRYLLDSNSSRIDDLVKDTWKLNFKDSILKGLGKLEEGKMIVNKDKKLTINNVTKTLKEWADTPKDSLQAAALLGSLGMKFSDTPYFMEQYENRDEVKDAVNWVIKEGVINPLSDLYEGDIQGRLKVLMQIEIDTTTFAVDLIHINSAGKKVYGVSLKNHFDKTAAELNGNPDLVKQLLGHHNLTNSVWLQQMALSGREMQVVVLEDIKQEFGRGKHLSKSTPADIGVMHVNAILGNGIIPIIRTADKKTEFAIQFSQPTLRLDRNTMIQRLQGYLYDEIKTANIFNTNKESKLRRIKTYADQGGELRFFKSIVNIPRQQLGKKLNDKNIRDIVESEETVEALNKFLDSSIDQSIATLHDLNIIRPGQKGSIFNVGLNDQLLDNLKSTAGDPTPGSNMASKTGRLLGEQLTYEQITGVIEQSKLFMGDLAQYGQDMFKRTSGMSGTKIYPSSNPILLNWMNEHMENLGFIGREHSNIARTVVRADVKIDSPLIQEYIEMVKILNPKMLENLNEEGENILESTYNNMDEFDGGGFMHLDSYRSLLWRAGKWSDRQEALYQKIMKGEEILNEDLAFFPALKPQVFAPFVEDNVRLMTFHKFALFPLIPQLMPGRTYDQINNDMVKNKIDYMVFGSVAKVGAPTLDGKNLDPFYREGQDFMEYSPMQIIAETGDPAGLSEFDFDNIGIQVEVAPKIKTTVPIGTQSRTMLPVNIYENGEISEKYKESGLEPVINEYNEIIYTTVKRDIKALADRLGLKLQNDGRYLSTNMKRLTDTLISELDKRDMPMHTKTGIMNLLTSPTPFINQLFERDKIESILYSIVTNSIIKRKMPGDLMVLQSSTGLEIQAKALKQNDYDKAKIMGLDIGILNGIKPLKFYRKEDSNDPTSKTLAMQVMLPHRFKELGLGNLIDINNVDSELRELIGFRIPTEGLNSIDFIEVVGYLPPAAGSTIIVPSEIVGKSGSDYDIDKLTLYFPNYIYNEENNTVSKVPYLTNENSTVKERYEVMKQEEPRDITLEEFKKLSIPQQNIQIALQNRIQELMKAVLENPTSFDQLISPVGAFEVKRLAKEIANLRETRSGVKTNPGVFNEMLNFRNIVNQSYRMWAGIGGVGITAVSATQHVKAQRAGLDWGEGVEFNFEGIGFSLSKVNDIQDNFKISSILAEYITGYVDVTKEDFVFDINAGVEYTPIHMMLIRSGVPIDQVAYFMSQPIIDEYVKLMETQRGLAADYSPSKSSYLTRDDIIQNLKNLIGQPGSSPIKFN